MRPLLILYTGDGKGKTTAALGAVMRAWGWGARCAVVQFLKAAPEGCGEFRAARRLGIHWENHGKGFVRTREDEEASREEALRGMESARELCACGKYDIVVLDEVTWPLKLGLVDEKAFLSWLEEMRRTPGAPTLILTGRGASPALVAAMDTVTEMVEVKHHYKTLGEKARKLIEF